MTAYCRSSTSRSRPLTFLFMNGGVEHVPEPVPPNQSVETPDDDPLERPLSVDDPGLPLGRPSKKIIAEDERGTA